MKELAAVFKALADEARLRILNLLFRTGELCVCDIEATTGFTQTKVSRHLLESGTPRLKPCLLPTFYNWIL